MEVKPSVKLYKIELYLLKIIPMLLALINFINIVLSFNGIDIPLLSYMGRYVIMFQIDNFRKVADSDISNLLLYLTNDV